MNKLRFSTTYLILLIAIFLASCKSQNKSVQNTAPVHVVPFTVKPENVTYYDTYPGTAAANDEVQLRSQVSGFITGIFFKEGSHVQKGIKLYEIDRRKYLASYESAKASVQIANANLEKAQRDADRYKKLDAQNAIAKQVLDDALTGLQNMEMQLKSAKASLVNAETDFNYSLITAPFAGSIGLSQVKPGAFVSAGQTLLNTISSDDPIAVDFIVDQKTLPYLIKLQNAKAEKEDSTFKVSLPDNSDYKHVGRLSIIDRAVDPQTGTIKIRTIFPNPEGLLRPGMSCKIKVLNAYSGKQINIPFRAIVEQMGEYFVYLINEKDTVKQRRIEVGPAQGEFVVVRSGLNPGDKIVLEGLQKVHPGSFVSADTTHIVNQASSTPNKAVQVNTESKSNPDEVKGSDKNNGTKNKGDKSKGESKKEEEKRGNKM